MIIFEQKTHPEWILNILIGSESHSNTICMSVTPKAVGFVSALRKVRSLESVQNVAMGFTLDKNVLKYNKDECSDEKMIIGAKISIGKQ